MYFVSGFSIVRFIRNFCFHLNLAGSSESWVTNCCWMLFKSQFVVHSRTIGLKRWRVQTIRRWFCSSGYGLQGFDHPGVDTRNRSNLWRVIRGWLWLYGAPNRFRIVYLPEPRQALYALRHESEHQFIHPGLCPCANQNQAFDQRISLQMWSLWPRRRVGGCHRVFDVSACHDHSWFIVLDDNSYYIWTVFPKISHLGSGLDHLLCLQSENREGSQSIPENFDVVWICWGDQSVHGAVPGMLNFSWCLLYRILPFG